MAEADKVIDNYLVWEKCNQRGIREKILGGSADVERIERIVEKARQDYREKDYGREEKLKLLKKLDSNPSYRCRIFKNCSWTKQIVAVEDLGTTLPRFGGLPPEIISGSVPEVIEFVKQADPEKYRSVKYIKNLKKFRDVLNQFLPWVVTPGERPSKRDKMNNIHGEKDWNIADTWGMINDGNHRTIAKILANNLDKIECYIGHRKND